MLKITEKFALHLNRRFGITPNALTYTRIFAAPWLALLVSEILSDKSPALAIITIIIYLLIITTDVLDGILARAISKERSHDHFAGGMLDRLADKILIIFILIPFGLNLFTFLIILAESILAYQAIHSQGRKKQATRTGKSKMFLQAFLVPILILWKTTNFLPDMFVYTYIVVTIIATYASVYSHYLQSDD